MKTALLFIITASTQVLWAAQAPDFTVRMENKNRVTRYHATPPPNHHFNIDAPMKLELSGGAKSSLEKHLKESVVFRTTKSADAYSMTLYLCDDKNTFCEKHTVSGGSENRASDVNQSASESTGPRTANNPKKLDHGFILNNPSEALKLAREKNKPLMIDFFGIWCPPCNMLDRDVFSTKEFRNKTSEFIKLKLDSDSPISWELKSKYKVTGYPTVIFASSTGDEITRIIGFKELKGFLKTAKASLSSTKAPPPVLTEPQKRNKEIEQLSSPNKELLIASLKSFPDSAQSIEWHEKLADIYEKENEAQKSIAERKALAQKAIAWSKKVKQYAVENPESDLNKEDLIEIAAGALEQIKDFDAAKRLWLEAAGIFEKKACAVKTSNPDRGYNLELAYALWKGGEKVKAKALYNKLIKAYPNEFTFHYAFASRLADDGEPESQLAITHAEHAYTFSYGDNRLRSAHLLARLYSAAKQNSKALEVLQKTLSEAKLPDDKSIRTHVYAKKLADLKEKISSSN